MPFDATPEDQRPEHPLFRLMLVALGRCPTDADVRELADLVRAKLDKARAEDG